MVCWEVKFLIVLVSVDFVIGGYVFGLDNSDFGIGFYCRVIIIF